VISPQATPEVQRVAGAGAIAWKRRGYQVGDLAGAWLAIAATDDAAVNRAIAQEAQERRVFLNVADQPDLCGFIAPGIVQRGDLTIAISTSGKSPAVARKVREEMEQRFPSEYGDLLALAAEVREETMRSPLAEGRSAERPTPEQWQRALSPEVLALLRDGRRAEAKALVVKTLGLKEAGTRN
jgi:precorrin-2 dehydrogenase/sirohydrochlorin ferrochelatase